MARYAVVATITSYAKLTVNAESEEEALRIAEETDGGEFTPDPDGEWDITGVIKISD